jgi:hypothetical protein
VDSLAPRTAERVDGGVHRNTPYFYRVAAFGPGGLTLALANAGPGIGRETWFNVTRVSVLAFMLVFYALVLFFMERARTGHKPFVRRLPGVDAIEEAIGRPPRWGVRCSTCPGSRTSTTSRPWPGS